MDTNYPTRLIRLQQLEPLYQHTAHLLGYDWPLLTWCELEAFILKAVRGPIEGNWETSQFGGLGHMRVTVAAQAVEILAKEIPGAHFRVHKFATYRLVVIQSGNEQVCFWGWDKVNPDSHVFPAFDGWAETVSKQKQTCA